MSGWFLLASAIVQYQCKIKLLNFLKKTFAVHCNFTYNSEAYDHMKLYFETSFEILVFCFLFLDRLSQTLKC